VIGLYLHARRRKTLDDFFYCLRLVRARRERKGTTPPLLIDRFDWTRVFEEDEFKFETYEKLNIGEVRLPLSGSETMSTSG
jgi:hypothetical protein